MLVKLKQLIWQWRGVLIAAPSVAGLVIVLRVAGLLQTFEWAALDQFFFLRGAEAVEKRIVIIGINEPDIRHLMQWPMSDAVLAKLLNNIKTQKPRAIGLDLYRDLPVLPGHQDLVKVFESTPNLIGIQKVIEDANSFAVDPAPALKAKGQIGANDFVLDGDGKIRRSFLSLKAKNGKTIFGFAMQLALIYLQTEGVNPHQLPGNKVQWGKAVFAPLKADDGGYVRAPSAGYQIMLNFQGPARSIPILSMTDVLENRLPPDFLRDRIVLIGNISESGKDLYYTPYSSDLLGIPERMSGVEIHANLISQILNATLSGRPLIRTWPKLLEWLWIFAWSLVGATLTWTQRYTGGPKGRVLLIAASILLPGSSLFGGSYLAFLGGWWIPVIPPLLSATGSAIAITAYTARNAGTIRKTFGRYLTDAVVANLLETPEGLKLGGQRKKVTIMMTDLRGFSAVSERFPPETVVTFLNIYLGAMADVITQYNGTIDEFIGDAILVIFGAPQAREDDAQRAVACAVAMQLAMDAVNEQIIQQFDMPKLEMGIGINTGEVVVGNIGSAKRAKYGVVGSHVNLTGRIESYTVGGQILISEYTLKEAGDIFSIEGEMQVEPKGIKQPITLYDITGVYGDYHLFLPKKEDNLITLKKAISINYTVLDGKHIVGTMFPGSLVKLSETSAELASKNSLIPLSNIKINLLTETDQDENMGDLYAKVMGKSVNGNIKFSIRFTAVPPDVAVMLSELLAQRK